MEYRKFGSTNRLVSRLGLGGGFLSAMSVSEGVKIVDMAFRSGINYFDVAPSYEDGLNEKIIHEALGDRMEEVLIATKVLSRSYDEAKEEIKGSIGRLGKVDLVQLHSIDTTEALELAFSDNGAIRAVEELNNEGIIKYIGITNHFDPKILEASLGRYKFDVVMMPLGIINAIKNSFEYIIEKVNRDMAVVGILVFGGSSMGVVADKALRYSLSLPTSTLLVGPRTVAELEKDIDIASKFTPLSYQELEELKVYTQSVIKNEIPWWFNGPVGIKK